MAFLGFWRPVELAPDLAIHEHDQRPDHLGALQQLRDRLRDPLLEVHFIKAAIPDWNERTRTTGRLTRPP